MKLLGGVDGDEVSLVRRAANKRRFLLLKGDDKLDSELEDILEVPWEREGAMLDEIRKDGITDETVEKAFVAAVRLFKGIEGEFSPELVEKLGTELYGRKNPKLNSSGADADGELFGSAGGAARDGSGSGAAKDGSGRDGELIGTGDKAPKVAEDSDGDDAEPDGDDDDNPKKKGLFGRKKKATKSDVDKADESADIDDEMATNEGGTVEVQVPVRKEDGTWDFSGVPSESRPFFEEIVSKADKTEKELSETKVALQKADDELRNREMVEKAAAFSHVAPTDELAPILKEASGKLDEETFTKLESLLSAAEARITKGDLFQEMGRTALNDGTDRSDAWTEAVKKADEMVEKSDKPMSQDQALAKVWEANPALYDKYIVESGMGVS